jgi:hypothetical protein
MKNDLVVLSKRHVLVVLDLTADGNDSTGDSGDFGCVGERDPALGLPLGFILQNQDSGSYRLDCFERIFLGHIDLSFKQKEIRHQAMGRSYYGAN